MANIISCRVSGGSHRFKSLFFTSLGHFSNDLNTLLFSILITYYYRAFGISLALLGVVAILSTVSSGLLSIPVGSYADRSGKHAHLMAVGIAIIGISVILFALSFVMQKAVMPLMVLASITLGLGQSFYHPIGAAIIRITHKKDMASTLGINGAFGSIGRSLLPAVLIPMIIFYGEPNALMLLAFYLLIASAAIYSGLGFLREPKSLSRAHAARIGKSRVKAAMAKYKGMLIVIIAMVFLRAMFLEGTLTYISQYLVNELHSEIAMGFVLTIGFLAAIIGQPVFGKLTELKGGKFTTTVTTVLSMVFFICFLISGSNLAIDTATYALYVFTSFTGFPVLLGYVGQLVPKSISTKSNGLVWGLGNTVGGGLGLAVMAILLVHINLTLTMWIMTAFIAASTLLLPFLPGSKRKIKGFKEKA
ncbi:MAG: MFS transporter [Candidatus Micrarchaeaceae archaeon]